MDNTRIKEKYKSALYSYGALALLEVLKYQEENEDFYSCQIIIDTLKENCDWFEGVSPSNQKYEAITQFIEASQLFGLEGKPFLNNYKDRLPMYVKEIIEQCKIQKEKLSDFDKNLVAAIKFNPKEDK